MRTFTLNFLALVVICLICLLGSCKPDKSPEYEEKIQIEKLKEKTWRAFSVTFDGQDRADLVGMTLAISGNFSPSNPKGPYDYVTAGNKPIIGPWPITGTFIFGDDPLTQLMREDNVTIQYSLQSNGHLLMEFRCASCSYNGRLRGVNGLWEFEFE